MGKKMYSSEEVHKHILKQLIQLWCRHSVPQLICKYPERLDRWIIRPEIPLKDQEFSSFSTQRHQSVGQKCAHNYTNGVWSSLPWGGRNSVLSQPTCCWASGGRVGALPQEESDQHWRWCGAQPHWARSRKHRPALRTLSLTKMHSFW